MKRVLDAILLPFGGAMLLIVASAIVGLLISSSATANVGKTVTTCVGGRIVTRKPDVALTLTCEGDARTTLYTTKPTLVVAQAAGTPVRVRCATVRHSNAVNCGD